MPAPQSPVDRTPDAPTPSPAAGSRGPSERDRALVVALCAAALPDAGAAAAAARDALLEGQGSAGRDSTDPGQQLPLADLLAGAWQACLRRSGRRPEGEEGSQGFRAEPGGVDGSGSSAVIGRSGDLAGDVRAAARDLEPIQRAGLVLRGRPEVAAAEVAQALGLEGDEALDRLVGRARLTLRARLHGEASPELDDDPPECVRALGLMARRRDAGLARHEDREWLRAHLATCPRCPERRLAIGEAALAWRAWTPPDPVPVGVPDSVPGSAPTAELPVVAPRRLAAGEPATRPPVLREIRRRGVAALAGAGLIVVGAVVLAPGSSTHAVRGPGHPHRGLAQTARRGRPGFTSARVRLPAARPVR